MNADNLALVAPVRNCDRFADGDMAADTYEAEGGERDYLDFARWLFAPAKTSISRNSRSSRRKEARNKAEGTITTQPNQHQHTMNINDMTIGEAREIAAMLGVSSNTAPAPKWKHPLIGKRVLVRTYSAGVHIGTLKSVNPDNAMECHLADALRLWKWEGGGLSLSAVAHNGIKDGRLNRTDEVVLTNAIEYIPTTPEAEATYVKFVED